VLAEFLRHGTALTAVAQRQRIYPVTGPDGQLVGVVTRRDLLGASRESANGSVGDERTIGDVMSEHLATAYPDETLRDVAYRMAERGVTRMPVIARGPGRQIVGIVTLPAMLAGRLRDLQEERDSERILQIARPRMGPGSAFRSGNGTG
jgi:chloride channel protein, CIC family